MITRDDILRLARSRGITAKPAYVDALLAGMETIREAGILETPLRTAHFMAQVAQETGGFTIIRESLHYTTAKRLREVWPARFRSKSNAELAPLLRNGVALGDAVYMGRMGNTKPGDGYAFRGGGFLQTTGKYAVEKYAKALGMIPRADMLDDLDLTLKFACLEWQQSGCNEWADENDIVKVSKAINTGSATSNVRPVNLEDRKRWFAQAWSIWGERGTPDSYEAPPALTTETQATAKIAAKASPVVGLGLLTAAWDWITGTVDSVSAVLLEAATKASELAPVQSLVASLNPSGNMKQIGAGIAVWGVVYAVSRKLKAKQEGEAG